MSTQTLNAETLVSEWKNATTDRSKLQIRYSLRSLLEKSLQTFLTPEELLLLTEFKENFDWEVDYSVKNDFDLCASYTHEIDCKNAEEVSAILTGKKEIDEDQLIEEFNPYEAEVEVSQIGEFYPSVWVSQLQLKKNEEEVA